MAAQILQEKAVRVGSVEDARDSASAWKKLAEEAIARVEELERREKYQAERIAYLLDMRGEEGDSVTNDELDKAPGLARLVDVLAQFSTGGELLAAEGR